MFVTKNLLLQRFLIFQCPRNIFFKILSSSIWLKKFEHFCPFLFLWNWPDFVAQNHSRSMNCTISPIFSSEEFGLVHFEVWGNFFYFWRLVQPRLCVFFLYNAFTYSPWTFFFGHLPGHQNTGRDLKATSRSFQLTTSMLANFYNIPFSMTFAFTLQANYTYNFLQLSLQQLSTVLSVQGKFSLEN